MRALGTVCVLLIALSSGAASAVTASIDASTGRYVVSNDALKWQFSGSLGASPTNVKSQSGRDRIGTFKDLSFDWSDGGRLHGTIRCYDLTQAVLFRVVYLGWRKGNGVVFPKFTSFPEGLRPFSFRDQTFATPAFELSQTATPWLLFDESDHAAILSPASNFMVATMVGDGRSSIGEGLNLGLRQIPPGFSQDTLLAFGNGIEATWSTWGAGLRALYRRPSLRNDADVLLEKYGYWTDNGADYYYNYDSDKGYAGTLLALRDAYRREGIPLGYMQLDSWWYDKTSDDAAGRPGGATKNPRLPLRRWNRYGGVWNYEADRDVFPRGLEVFDRDLLLPLAVHNRWIDRNSPYHEEYRFSGVAAVDPAFWNHVAAYLSANGCVCYEQDWLDTIYDNSPELSSEVGPGDAFTDCMANACRNAGLDMQYCMGTPRFFLQGVKYPNLTTIRTSDDRFEPSKWAHFLYVSQLAQAVGIWPWCDVFKSGELPNMILAVLSAGPVGTGDALGKENKANILRAARPDGVIVKPDRSLLPVDETYLDPKGPFVASTYTDHGGFKTTYLFAFPRKRPAQPTRRATAQVRVQEPALQRRAYLYDLLSGAGHYVDPTASLSLDMSTQGYAFGMLAPVSRSGIVLLGDLGKIVPTGKKRILDVRDLPGGLEIQVSFAKGEESVVLEGVSPVRPLVKATVGRVQLVTYDSATRHFTVKVLASGIGAVLKILPDPR